MIVFMAVLILVGPGLQLLRAGANKWISIGPFGGSIQALAIDPQHPETLYAGMESGVFKSADAGASWTNINSALNVYSVAIDPRTPTTLYAASYGVFKSIDGGATWSPSSSGLPGLLPTLPLVDVDVLAIDPQNPDTIFAGTRTGIFKSQDGGANWKATNSALSSLPTGPPGPITVINRLAIDPQNPNTVYTVGTFPLYLDGNLRGYTRGMFKTTDGGDSWKPIILPDSRPPGSPLGAPAFALDAENPGTIYASGGFPAALLKSADGGATWSVVNSRVSFFSIASGPQGSNTLYGANISGVFKSMDGGLSWNLGGLSAGAGFSFLIIDPQSPSTRAYASGFDGLFKTDDGGANWTKLNSGLSNVSVRTLVIDPLKSSSLYIADYGLTKSTDGGSNWRGVNTGLFYPSKITIDPQNTGTVYSAGFQQCDESPEPDAVFKSSDGGSSWSAAMSGLPVYPQVKTLVIDPTNTNTLYTGTDHGVFKSIDAARSWNAVNQGMPLTDILAVAVDPRSSSTVYAGGSSGLWKSTDGGVSWNAANIPAHHSITVLALDPQNPRTVYAGGSGAIFKSTDAGTNWTVVGTGLPDNLNRMTALVIDPQNPSTLYAGTSGVASEPCSIPCSGYNDGVFKSTDGGETWTAVTLGLTTPHVSSLAIDQQHPSRLYAGTQGGGVFAITFASAPVVSDFRFDKANVVGGGSYSVTISGSNLTAETFFDVQFSTPASTTSNVALNWQVGPVASHAVPAAIADGTWTITGVRAHELEADHTDTFSPVSASITVSH